MKKTIIRAIAVLSLMASFSAMTAYAQAVGGIKFEAPFAFTVGGKTLPAGKYSIERLRFDTTDVMMIRSADNRGIVNFAVTKKELGNEPETSKIIFHRYGAKSFLKQIHYNYSNIGYELPKSRSEREMIKKKNDLSSAEVGTFEVIAINGQ